MTANSSVMASVFLEALLILFLNTVAAGNKLTLTNDCPCPGHNITFECTLTGGGTTVWQGRSVFDCPRHSNEIVLRHINFDSSVSGECNNGSIIGESVGINQDSYTSQLNILYREDFVDENVMCIHDNGITFVSTFTAMIIHNTIVSFPSPSNVHLIAAAPQQLTFSWNSVAPNCAAIHYNILAQNCGNCPSSTPHNTVVCHDMNIGGNLTCSFVVQNIRICDDVTGNMSDPVKVHLKVSSAPVAVVIPHYSYSSKELIALTTKFEQMESFKISDGFDGSTISYVLTYNDSFSGESCGISTLPASSCVEGICTKIMEIYSLSCSPLPRSINVTVAGHNVLGKGLDSYPITTSTAVNHFVDVDVMQTSYSVVCTYLNQKSNVEKTCSIVYGPVGRNCRTSTQTSQTLSNNIVTIGLPLEDTEQEYCFSVTASNGSFTAIVEGIFKHDPNITTHQSKTCGVALGVSISVFILLNISTVIASSIIVYILLKMKREVKCELERVKARETHGIYEELDYMYVDRPKRISTQDNVSYSMKVPDSEISVYEDTK